MGSAALSASSAVDTSSFRYQAFGLAVESELLCPELLPGGDEPEVSVRFGPVARDGRVERHWFRTSTGGLVLVIQGVGAFEIQGGNSITIDPEPDASIESIRLFLLGSAFGALLHQRGVLALHGSTIASEDACICVAGDSGAGKSTSAAALVARGFRLLTDDVSALEVSDTGKVVVQPSYPQHKLWEDSLGALSIDPKAHSRVLPQEGKRAVRVEHSFSSSPASLSCIFVLEKKLVDDVSFDLIRGSDKLSVLVEHTYRGYFLEEMGLLETHFQSASAVATAVPIIRVIRPDFAPSHDAIADGMQDWIHQLA